MPIGDRVCGVCDVTACGAVPSGGGLLGEMKQGHDPCIEAVLLEPPFSLNDGRAALWDQKETLRV